MLATHPYIPRISVVFDFDSTLATDSLDAVVQTIGMSRKEFDEDWARPLGDGWDDILRRGHALLQAGRARGRPITLDLMKDAAREVRLFAGVQSLRQRLQELAAEIDPDLEIELVVLSSGFAEVIEATGIGRFFDRIWASTLAYQDGEAVAVKRIIPHPEKSLYLEALGKGVSVDGSNAPERAGEPVADEDMHTPFDQMIYLGDGASDLHAFGFLANRGGTCIAIDGDGRFDEKEEMTAEQRVDNLAPPDYSEGGELSRSLEHAVRSAANRIALRKLSRGE